MSKERVGLTALFTGEVFRSAGISHDQFGTAVGKGLLGVLRPLDAAYQKVTGSAGLEAMVLGRHQVIDRLLTEAIESGRVSQVLELAAGLSPRGWTFAERYGAGGLRYVESDLPGMVGRKQRALTAAHIDPPGHSVVTLDALATEGPTSLMEVVKKHLDPRRGTVIISEGLLNYFPRPVVEALWCRIAQALQHFPNGMYLSDMSLREVAHGNWVPRYFVGALGIVVRGAVHLHYDTPQQALEAVGQNGFATARIHPATPAIPGHPPLSYVVEAT